MLSFFKILPRKSAEGWRKWVTTFNQLASGVKYDAVPGHSNDSNQTPITVQLALWLEEPCASGFPTIPLFIYFVLLLAFLFSFSSCGTHHLWLSTVSLSGHLKYLCEMGSCPNNLLTSLWSQKEKSLILTNFPGIMLDDIFSPVRTCSTMVHNFLINILLHFAPCYNCIIMF